MGNIQGQDKKLTTFQLYMKTQKEVLFTTEISKGYRPAKKRNQQAGIKHMQININHESFDHRRISQVHFNNESTIKGGNRMSFIHNNQYKNSINGLKDDRSKVDKDKYPYTCIGMLQVNFENRRNRSTAFLISSNWLLTSAHNLYSREYKMMGSQAVFVLGLQQKIEITRQNGKQIRTKLQIGDRFQISTWRIPQQYISLQSDQEAQLYDFALVKLKNIYYLQQRYGYLGLDSTWALRPNQCKELTIAGYPKQIKSNDNCKFLVDGKGQWTQILYQNQKQKQKGFIYLNYEIYTSPGQSGSPIFYQAPDKQIYMIGIHTLGGDEYNSGILMTPRCRQIINGWIQEMKSIFDISNLNIGNGGLMSFALNFGLVSNNITQLHLENNIIGAQGIKLLMKNSWQNLKILNLQDNNIKTQGALAIADPMHGWVHLQELNLNNTMIFDLGCVSILKNRSWTKMRQLHLRKCQLTRQTIDELLKTKWNLLQSLTISANAFDLNDIKRIFAFIKIDENTQEKRFTRLRHLQISRTNIGNQGLQLIINCDYDLQTLAVSGIGMTYEAMKMLTEMKWKRQTLKILQIDWNKMISVEGILYMTPKNFPSITYLNLDWTTLGSQGVRQLVKHQWPYLKTLSLNHNYLQDRGLNELRSFATLEVIIVEGNNISSEGFIEFSKKKQWQNLLQINLRSNHIEKYGFCEAIIHLKGLNRIDINNNGLNSHHKREIKQFAQGVNKQLQIMVDMGEEADFS